MSSAQITLARLAFALARLTEIKASNLIRHLHEGNTVGDPNS
jgi:hypothetical protein